MDIIGRKYIYFAISLLVMVPGLIALMLWGLNLSIDFTGGSRLALSFPDRVEQKHISAVKKELSEVGVKIHSAQVLRNIITVRTDVLAQKQDEELLRGLSEFKVKQEEFDTIGPTIGAEITQNAVKALAIASILIILYITWAFRSVPKPASSFRFGVCAIGALIHDVLVVVGVFAVLGHFLDVEINSMFVTALLTIIGFSVHDTIVVFDRIRENLKRAPGISFQKVVNESILQTLDRSLNTSLTVVLVLSAMLLFGGQSIKWFIVALLVGIISGTYSSIFNASPLLVLWHEWSLKRRKV
ncbi:MAG: protein translocase subunit SecF [Candidatus Levybacteria bacterium]|nr:protein translocase subunit SecF [Candidatus Levybacteria bacterium]